MPEAFETHRYAVEDGIELVADWGGPADAPCVVLMHGGGQTRHSWHGTMGRLVQAGYHVGSFDARGHGESGWAGPGGYTLAKHARDLARIVAGVGGPVAIVGASLGGATALAALGAGMRPAAVVLVDIVPEPDRRGAQRIRDFMLGHPDGFASLDEAVAAVADYNPRRSRAPNPDGLRRNLRRGAGGRLRWHWDPAFLGRDLEDELAELRCTVNSLRGLRDVPVLLIRGTESDVVSNQALAHFREALPAIETLDVTGAGHMVAGDRNDAFDAGVIAFLARHCPAERRVSG